MKAFIYKYKWSIVIWLTLIPILWIWQPKQSEYYLEKDIAHFKSRYLLLILFGVGLISSLSVLIVNFQKTKSFKNSVSIAILFSLYLILPLFLMQDIFLAGSLFLNRQYKIGDSKKIYVVNYFAGGEKIKNNLYLYDISEKSIVTDEKAISHLYSPGLNAMDTVILNLNKGMFGINYFTKLDSTK